METKVIHEDERGQIICFYFMGKEYTILITKKGYARGGCIHNVSECGIVLDGLVSYHIKGKRVVDLVSGSRVFVPPETPHYFVAKLDSIFLEWGAPPDQKKRKDPEYRKIVDKINESQ